MIGVLQWPGCPPALCVFFVLWLSWWDRCHWTFEVSPEALLLLIAICLCSMQSWKQDHHNPQEDAYSCVFVGMHVCVHVFIEASWQLGYRYSRVIYPIFWDRDSHWPGIHWKGWASLPANRRNPAVSSYPVLGSQVHARTPVCSHRCLEIKLEASCSHSKRFPCNCLPAFSLVLSWWDRALPR